MKKLPFLAAFLLALFVMASAAKATVIVYKGSASRLQANGTTGAKKSVKVYFVVDFNTAQHFLIFVTTTPKTVFNNGFRSYGLTEVKTSATSANPTQFLVAANAGFTNGLTFSTLYARFQGTKSPLVIAANNGQTVQFPKSLTGTISDVDGQNGPGVVFLLPSITLGMDKTYTFPANATLNLKSGTQVAAEIVADFVGAGYTAL